MAFYRCGGGGIPSSLKTDMNAVFNKKFGTAVDYPAEGWPDDVNLMGPLPEKTIVFSPIAHITDGADEVPIKSWEVEIPPTLTGKSAIECAQTGTNLVALNASPQQAKRDFGITINTQTADTLNITTTGVAYACERLFYSLKKGTYAVKFLATSSDSFTPVISIYRTNGTGVKFNIQPNTITTFTLADDVDIDIRLFASGSGDTTVRTVEFSYLQIEVGSTVSTYSQYAPTVSTVNLGRTIYGGEVDIVNGVGQETHNYIDMGSLSWTYHAPSGNLSAYFDTYLPNDSITGNSQEAFDGYTEDYTSIKSSQIALSGYDDMVMALGHGSRKFFLCDQRYTDAQSLTTALTGKILVYPLKTPSTFTFTPITPTPETALGVNNFWADEGDTEVTYRADINLALGGQ